MLNGSVFRSLNVRMNGTKNARMKNGMVNVCRPCLK
jgi:hypothetical protein